MSLPEPSEGDRYTVTVRVFHKAGMDGVHHQETVESFLHQWDDTGDWSLLLCQDWLDALEATEYQTAEERREFYRAHADAVPFDETSPRLVSAEPSTKTGVL